MKDILERFEKVSAAHGLTTEAAAAMRGLLQDAHTAGYAAHMAIADTSDGDEVEEDSLPGAPSEDEPEDEEEATVRTLVKVVRKEIRKSLKKEVRKALRKAVVHGTAH